MELKLIEPEEALAQVHELLAELESGEKLVLSREEGMLSLRIGPLAQRRELRPAGQVWCRSRLDWLDDLPALPGVETQPGAAKSSEASR